MKEFFIKDKVIDLAKKLRITRKYDEYKLARAIARIESLVACELDKSFKEVQRHMNDYISQTIRKEIV